MDAGRHQSLTSRSVTPLSPNLSKSPVSMFLFFFSQEVSGSAATSFLAKAGLRRTPSRRYMS